MNNIVFTSSLLAVSIIAVVLYVLPAYDSLQDKKQERSEYIEVLGTINDVREKFEVAQQWRSDISRVDQERLDEIIPNEFDNVRFLNDLLDVAAGNGITKGPVSIEVKESELPYVTYEIGFEFEAPYQGAAAVFMEQLEESLTLFDIQSFNMSLNEETGGVDYALQFNTYALQ